MALTPFIVSEGSHRLSCRRCGGSTLVYATMADGELALRTEVVPIRKGSTAPKTDPAALSASSNMRTDLNLGEVLMAKRKLNDAQRKSLRSDIDSRMAGGASRREIVQSLAAKYKISPISMRWYLRTQTAPESAARPPVALEVSPSPEPAARSLAAEKTLLDAFVSWKPGAGDDQTLVTLLSGLTHQKIKRLLEAKKLLPKLDQLRRHESHIRGQIRQLEKKLESETGKARGVEEQIRRLAAL